ncbi:hypothetical protein LRP52_35965 [Photobacterium sp. ZSDE20]|uniref:Uncharacterized protein n=1 Tax=Photobacterium pectinilyticum TaxID=2906793 RepID=A0ABT1N5W8_9GAMM|nr:hypothetical protein [Photobacterium sp. ZSDE20]MCQ1060126.1 hypothetical protein [Photobacterium sp. ZSDE20]MDD1827582.1 hypothetical protein [Photobacterium sp. ZSDE20]
MKTLTSFAVLLISLTSGYVPFSVNANAYLDFKPSDARAFNFEGEDRNIWKANGTQIFYAPQAMPYIDRDALAENKLCFDLVMKNDLYEQAIVKKFSNANNTTNIQMIPMSDISLSIYEIGNATTKPLATYKIPENVSKSLSVYRNLCLDIGDVTDKRLEKLEVRTYVQAVTVNQSETNCVVVTSLSESVTDEMFADADGKELFLDEQQFKQTARNGLVRFTAECRGDDSTETRQISDKLQTFMTDHALKSVTKKFISWANIESSVNAELYNKMPSKEIDYVKTNSNKVVTVEELKSNVGNYLANRILTHNGLSPLVDGAGKGNTNTRTTTDQSTSNNTTNITIPSGLSFISLRSSFNNQSAVFSYSDIMEAGFSNKSLEPLHAGFLRNAEMKYSVDKIIIGFPNKTILPYYGDLASLPNNWKLCDGNEHDNNAGGMVTTPNVVNRYLKGVSSSEQLLADGGSVPLKGQAKSSVIKIDEIYKGTSVPPDHPEYSITYEEYDRGAMAHVTPKSGVGLYELRDKVVFILGGYNATPTDSVSILHNEILTEEPPFLTIYWICKIY